MSAAARGVALLACALAATAARADAPHLRLDVALDPEPRRFHAVAELAAPGEFRFALHDALVVSDATVDGQPATVERTRHEGSIQEWRVAAARGAQLRIEYGGTLPALDRSLDHRRVLGTLPPMAAGEGSFLHSGSGWYPRPAALFSYRVRLSLPGNQRGLVPGRLAAEEMPRDARDRYVAAFEFAPQTEGIDLMAGPYIVKEKLVPRGRAEPLRLRTYFFRDLDALAEGYLEDSRRYIELYSREIGGYPFDAFSIVASPLPVGFGMPTLTYIGASVLKLPFIRATSLGHEVLHNWWGNGVYPDYAKGNWSEGLTTFMADYLYKERESAAAAREMRLAWLRDFAAVPAGSHGTLASFRSRTHGAEAAVGYGKAAMLFVMLRDAIGEDAFRRGIRRFWRQHRFKVAAWDDLRAAFEQAADRPLASFFDQWVERAGGPTIRLTEARARTEHGRTTLTLTLTQTAPVYALRVPVEIASGTETQMRWIGLDREHDAATLELDVVPESVRLDPEWRVWRLLERDELPPILRQWIISRAPRVAVVSPGAEFRHAAEALARRFFEMPAAMIEYEDAARGREPALIIGLKHDVDMVIAKLDLPPRPTIADRGSAQVWTIRRQEDRGPAGPPVAVVSARDLEALKSLARPLPHYGAQSYLALEGDRVIERGVWPASGRSVRVTQ